MATRMKPPSPPAPGLNSSKYLSMGTASRMSWTKMPGTKKGREGGAVGGGRSEWGVAGGGWREVREKKKRGEKNAPHAAITDVPARAVEPGGTRFSRHSIRRSSDAPSRTSLEGGEEEARGRGACVVRELREGEGKSARTGAAALYLARAVVAFFSFSCPAPSPRSPAFFTHSVRSWFQLMEVTAARCGEVVALTLRGPPRISTGRGGERERRAAREKG